ncbi:ABC transporter substrate-binding protein [Brevibacillus ruminantium]|uniref:ABC transporter substrate-binding protein n=1 Tax=Brevibacillus ruminantium TaxID=2950604 RepID=A0ABY4WGA9_9BACL|nr:ABC transporter substrate-binding protein [Brevibacillus ruminantium]USG66193.1 ABC transporter substrate-binding protein [Brevibacillus ruminantium]
MYRRISYFFALLLVLAMVGCGNGNANQKTSEAVGANAHPSGVRAYKHSMGETLIPVKPEKVVTLQYVSQMLSVGVKPIGAPEFLLENMGEVAKGIESVGDIDKFNYEKILSLEPDLIIAGDVEKDTYEKLSGIAPTVVIPWMDYDMPEHVKVIGDILNRQAEAEAWQKSFEAKVQAAKEKIQGTLTDGQKVAIYNIRPKEFYVYGVRNFGFTLYKSLGLTPPDPVRKEIEKDPNFWATPITLEMLPEYAADYIFITTFQDGDSKRHYDEIKKSALWKALPAVKNNHVFEIDFDRWFGYTPHDVEFQVDDAVKWITGQGR